MTFLGEIEILGKAPPVIRDLTSGVQPLPYEWTSDLRPDASTGKVSAAMRLA